MGYLGLNGLCLGLLRSKSAALRWGWNRYFHTSYLMAEMLCPTDDTKYFKSKLDSLLWQTPAGDVQRILLKLRMDGQLSKALVVFEWMRKKGIYAGEDAVLINLIGRVRGCYAAERHVRNLPKEARNEKAYGELLQCYVHEHRTEEALLHFQKMKALGFASSPRPFNEIMHLYAKTLQIDKVLGVLAELTRCKVLPDNDSYRLCISSFGLVYDLDGMERMLREMEAQSHIVMDWCTYAVVAKFYEREFMVDKATDALEKARVLLQKKDIRRRSPNYLMSIDYEHVIKSLVKLGEFDEAIKFLKEWDALGNWRSVDDVSVPCIIIEEYVKKGSLKAAFYEIYDWEMKGKAGVYKLSRILCDEYIKVGELLQAYLCFWGSGHDLSYELVVQRLFFQYLEEECGSFFPLSFTRSCCTRSLETVEDTTFLVLIPIHMESKYYVDLLEHPENSAQVANTDYENIIKSLVESGELNEARKMAIEWEANGNLTSLDDLHISTLIIEGYCNKCLFVEAEAMAEAWTRVKECWVRGIWLIIACHYQEHGKMVKAFECMWRYINLTPGLKCNVYEILNMLVDIIELSRGMNSGEAMVYY